MRKALLVILALLVVAAGGLVLRLPSLVRHRDPVDPSKRLTIRDAIHRDLAMRPMHGDEAIHTSIFERLWKEHDYRYDPQDYHGPTLHYATLPLVRLTGAKDYAQTDEFTYRIVPLIFGVGLIVLTAILMDGLGAWAVICAAVLAAISPAMVFYSRYYIQEMLFVFFTLGTIGCGWRLIAARSIGAKALWAIAGGIFAGLMYATKETWIVAAFCGGLAIWLTSIWTRVVDGRWVSGRRGVGGPVVGVVLCLAALVVTLGVGWTILSAGFKHPQAIRDSILTYKGNFARGTGENPHAQPWDYYLRILTFWKGDRGVAWSEALILALAAVGMGAAMRKHSPPVQRGQDRISPASTSDAPPEAPPPAQTAPPAREPAAARFHEPISDAVVADTYELAAPPSPPPPPRSFFPDPENSVRNPAPRKDARAGTGSALSPILPRFLTFYSLAMIALYSLIRYKTPWCLLGFEHSLILLAGVGAVYLIVHRPQLAIGAVAVVAIIYLSTSIYRPPRGEPFLRLEMPRLWMMLAALGVLVAMIALPRIGTQTLAAVALAAAAAQLGSQAYRMNYVPMYLDNYYNPYVYGHPILKFMEVPEKMRELARLSPAGTSMAVTVVGKDCWPIPWYLRDFTHVGYWANAADVEPSWWNADVVILIAGETDDAEVDESKLAGRTIVNCGLRTRVRATLCVKDSLWMRMLRARGAVSAWTLGWYNVTGSR